LCGVSRPHHFRGVTTVCMKLFNITRPDIAVFGQKDAQQCAVIQKMMVDLNISAEVVIGATHRDPDGLATSSRNAYLTALQRQEAQSISKALNIAKKMVDDGVRSVDRVVAEITHTLSLSRKVRVIYVQIVDRETMKLASREIVVGKQIITLAVWVDEIRLIDNALI